MSGMLHCMLQAAAKEVFGIDTPREFQSIGANHCIYNDNTVLAVPRKTADGKILIVQLTSFFLPWLDVVFGASDWISEQSSQPF